jgi:hypothetical protein
MSDTVVDIQLDGPTPLRLIVFAQKTYPTIACKAYICNISTKKMAIVAKKKVSFKSLLSAAQQLSEEEKQLLRLRLFGNDAIADMKLFEKALQQKKPVTKKTDKDIVALIKPIRTANHEKSKKMLH